MGNDNCPVSVEETSHSTPTGQKTNRDSTVSMLWFASTPRIRNPVDGGDNGGHHSHHENESLLPEQPPCDCNIRPKDFALDALLLLLSLAGTCLAVMWMDREGETRHRLWTACLNIITTIGLLVMGAYILALIYGYSFRRGGLPGRLVDVQSNREKKRQD